MTTINVRELQKHVRGCVKAAQRNRVVVTCHGIPTALIIGVKGTDWETLALQTNPSFWRMIEKRRAEKTVSLETMRKVPGTGGQAFGMANSSAELIWVLRRGLRPCSGFRPAGLHWHIWDASPQPSMLEYHDRC